MYGLHHIISLFDYLVFLLRPIHHSNLCRGLRHNHNSLGVLFSYRKIDNYKPAMETTNHFDIFSDILDLLCCPIENKGNFILIMVKIIPIISKMDCEYKNLNKLILPGR